VAQKIPTLISLSESDQSLESLARTLLGILKTARPGDSFELTSEESFAGGGSLPAWPMPTRVIRWRPAGAKAHDVCDRLRLADPSVLARLNEDAIVLDVRTIAASEYEMLAAAARQAASATAD